MTFRECFPEASKYWNYEKNGDMTPDNMLSKSGKEIYLSCPNNESHIFPRKIFLIKNDIAPFGCPFCSKKNNI